MRLNKQSKKKKEVTKEDNKEARRLKKLEKRKALDLPLPAEM